MLPERQKQKERIDAAKLALQEALNAHDCLPFKRGNSAVCDICRHDFGWWCPKSPTHTCDYSPPGHYDCCRWCHDPEERK